MKRPSLTLPRRAARTTTLAAFAALALLALPSPAAQTGHAVYRPGLTQARIPLGSEWGYKTAKTGVPVLASNLLEVVTKDHPDWRDRTLDVFRDGFNANDAVNPVSGLAWPWDIQDGRGVFAYEGEMFVEEGTEYVFYGRFNCGEALVLDGLTVVYQGAGNGWNYPPVIHGKWTASKTGWLPFNAWLWTFSGSHNPEKCQWGLQYNLDGFVTEDEKLATTNSVTGTNVWLRFVDPGNGTFFRTVTTNQYTFIGNYEIDDGSGLFQLEFRGVPTNATLVAVSGVSDGGHMTNTWNAVSGVLADIPPGDTTTSITVSLAANATALRFQLSHFDAESTNGLDVFEEWTDMVAVSPAPVVRIDSMSPGYTNLVVSGGLGSFGIGGSSGAVTIQVAAAIDPDFVSPVAEVELPPAFAVDSFEAEVLGLSTNTAYLVRAMATNNLGAAGFSPTVPFRTLEPGPPSVSVATTVCALFSAELKATVSDWGGGSWGVEAWIEVSADPSFPAGETQTLPPFSLSGVPPASATATATGLEMASNYFARVRAVNSWDVEAVSDPIAFSTSNEPIGFPEGATVVAEKGKVTASLAPTFVTEGTVYDVTVVISSEDGTVLNRRTWENQTGVETFAWTQFTSGKAVFVYTIEWSYEGRSGTMEVRGEETAHLADRKIDSLPKIDPAYEDAEYHGVYLRPGDTVEIIPSDGVRIDWHTNAVISVTPTNGVFVVEAIEPGATLLYETDLATGKTNNVTGVAIVLPTNNPAGGIYVHRKLNLWTWTDPKEWEVVSPGPFDYPNAPESWAFIVTPSIHYSGFSPDSKNCIVQITNSIVVGNLAVGQLGWIHHRDSTTDKTTKSHWAWILGDDDNLGGSIRFDSGDGSESRILTLGHAYNVSRVQFQVPVSTANNLAVDELWRVQDTLGWKNSWDLGLSFERSFDIGTNTFRNVRGYHYRYAPTKIFSSFEGNGCAARGFLQFYADILGSGTIRLEADSMVGCVQSSARKISFTGTWDVANGQNVSCYGGSGFTWPGTSLERSKEMIVRGSWLRADLFWPGGAFARSADEGDNWHMFKGWTNDWQNVLPRNLTLDGGCMYLHPNYLDAGWTQYENDPEQKRRILYDVGTFTVPAGPMGFLSIKKSNSSLRYPNQYMTVTNLDLASGAVLALELSDSTGTISNELRIVNEPTGWQDPDNGNRQFLPYFFANQQLVNNKQYPGTDPYIVPGSVVDNTYLIFRDINTKRVTRAEPSTDGTGYRRWIKTSEDKVLSDGTSYYAMLLAKDVTNEFATAGAVVTNLAGYLDMRGGSVLGSPTNAVSATCTLFFPDQPARLFNGNWGETNVIGCRIAGTNGLVKGGSGTLRLAASAEGVSGGVRVAGGTLALANETIRRQEGTNVVLRIARGSVAGDVRVEAGSRLVVGDQRSFGRHVRLFLNDRDWIPSYAHVRLESKAFADEIFVAGEPLRHGWYGSSESGADFVDDVHFEGPGRIHAGVFPTLLIFR